MEQDNHLLSDRGILSKLRDLISSHKPPFENVSPKKYEKEDAVLRYGKLVRIGREILDGSGIARDGRVDEERADLAKKILIEGIRETNPTAWAAYFEHCLIAPELERRIFTEIDKVGVLDRLKDASGQDFNKNEAIFLTWLHDLSILVSVSYSRKEFIGDRLLLEMGISKEVQKDLPSTRRLMETAEKMKIDGTRIKEVVGEKSWEEIFTEEQLRIADAYFASMNPMQRVINLADNLGKRGKEGVFNYQEFVEYLKSQETRYTPKKTGWVSTDWTTELGGPETSKRVAGSFLQAYVVDKSISWLREMGIEVNGILEGMRDYGPKFIIIVRHGELENPKNIVYNLDQAMDPKDIIHISETGKRQMTDLGKVIDERHFNWAVAVASDQQRAKESIEVMVGERKISIKIDERLNDVYAPGPYKRGMTMEDYRKMKGDVYTEEWREFNHESPEAVTQRMEAAFWEMTHNIGVGETAVLLSHGDAIAYLLNKLEYGKTADPGKLRDSLYPEKGQAIVYIIEPDGSLFSRYRMEGENKIKGGIY